MKRQNWLIPIVTVGVFGILNTEMGFIGILPLLAEQYHVSITEAGLLVSLFALAVAVAGPVMPLLLSGINRKTAMLLVLGVFLLGNIASMVAPNFTSALIARVVPAFLQPVYCSLAFSVAAASVGKAAAPKAVAKVFVGVSAGMVLGVPLSSLIAGEVSLQMAMAFFAAVNLAAFVATLIAVPSLPVREQLSYGEQLQVLRKPTLWLSILAVVLLNGAVFGVFSYLANYLATVTHLSWPAISGVLFAYGLANIPGSVIAGRLLSRNPSRTVATFPFALAGMYLLLSMTPLALGAMVVHVAIWGMLGGIGANINQYWISTAAPEAPDFANGLFLTAANLGTTLGTTACGLLIAKTGLAHMMFGGVALALFGGGVVFAGLHAERLREKTAQLRESA